MHKNLTYLVLRQPSLQLVPLRTGPYVGVRDTEEEVSDQPHSEGVKFSFVDQVNEH